MNIWIPGIFATSLCTAGRIWLAVRVRWPHGFNTTPLKPSAPSVAPIEGGNRNWNVSAASGLSCMTCSAALV